MTSASAGSRGQPRRRSQCRGGAQAMATNAAKRNGTTMSRACCKAAATITRQVVASRVLRAADMRASGGGGRRRRAGEMGRRQVQAQQQVADGRGQHRAQDDADLVFDQQFGHGAVRQRGHEQAHGEAHAAQGGHAGEGRPAHALGQAAEPQCHGQRGEQADADRLAEEQAEQDAEGERVGQAVRRDVQQIDAGVEEREQGQDQERHPRVHAVLQDDERRVRVAGQAVGGDREGQRDAGDGRVHAGLEHEVPHGDAEQHVGRGVEDAQAVEGEQGREAAGRVQQVDEMQVAGVVQGDDEHGAQVVQNGQRQQEHLEPGRHAGAEHHQHAQRERDVGRGRNRPAAQGGGVAVVEGGEHEAGDQHAAEGGEGRQGGVPGVGEMAGDELALELQADQEEEDRHQAVVDPQQRGLLQRDGAEVQMHRPVQQQRVLVLPAGVGDDEGGQRADDQHEAAVGLDLQEVADRNADVAPHPAEGKRGEAHGFSGRGRRIAGVLYCSRCGPGGRGCGTGGSARSGARVRPAGGPCGLHDGCAVAHGRARAGVWAVAGILRGFGNASERRRGAGPAGRSRRLRGVRKEARRGGCKQI